MSDNKETNKKKFNINKALMILGICMALEGIYLGPVTAHINKKKVQRVNKQVEAYEKTLPAEYMEYKHAVEHYRDSLMHAKRR